MKKNISIYVSFISYSIEKMSSSLLACLWCTSSYKPIYPNYQTLSVTDAYSSTYFSFEDSMLHSTIQSTIQIMSLTAVFFSFSTKQFFIKIFFPRSVLFSASELLIFQRHRVFHFLLLFGVGKNKEILSEFFFSFYKFWLIPYLIRGVLSDHKGML